MKTLENIFIRGFRVDEWALLRAKRLEAVKANSHLFLKKYEDEVGLADSEWIKLITQTEGKVFGLWNYHRLIGLTGVVRNRHDASGNSALFVMSYLDADYRGLGLSKLFYEARIGWAREKGFERAVVSHRDGNESSRRANAAFGFKWVGSEEITFGDGTKALDHRYELELK